MNLRFHHRDTPDKFAKTEDLNLTKEQHIPIFLTDDDLPTLFLFKLSIISSRRVTTSLKDGRVLGMS